MSKIIASAGIKGAHRIVERADNKLKESIDTWGPNQEVAFPNTGYYLPIIYGMLGRKIEKLKDMESVISVCRNLLPAPVKEKHHLPYLGPALDAGMATFFAEEMIEAIKYIENPNVYAKGEDITDGTMWLGAAEGGIKRLVWMPKRLKEETRDRFNVRAAEAGCPDLLDRIADETVAVTEEEVLQYITEKQHPVLTMDPIL